ncbi:MAG: hypothetical protein JOS17DRAFT_757890 [Linnemannia elongata]|nr:MAG: hypothetical protein JOS17DRAFT_757890 [Linnemannia elongata]
MFSLHYIRSLTAVTMVAHVVHATQEKRSQILAYSEKECKKIVGDPAHINTRSKGAIRCGYDVDETRRGEYEGE